MSLLDPVMRQVLAQSQEPRRRQLDWLTALERVSRATSIVGHLLIGSTMGRNRNGLGTLRNLMDHGVFITRGGKRALKLGLAREGGLP
jgi:hypothetical protein